MENKDNLIEVSIFIPLPLEEVFAAVVEELVPALANSGMEFKVGPKGQLTENNYVVGKILEWNPGTMIAFEWKQDLKMSG